MLPNVAITSRSLSTPAALDPLSRQAALAVEARRVARRRSVAAGVARRGQTNDRGLSPAASSEIIERARRRASRLSLEFHRTIESLWSAGEFDEALAIFREHKADLARRTGGQLRPN